MWSRIKRTLLRQFSHDVPHGLAACEIWLQSRRMFTRQMGAVRRILFARRPEDFDRLSSLTMKRAGEVREIE
jgi:hypothetical protein